MFGVFLFTVILFCYSFILSRSFLKKLFVKDKEIVVEKDETQSEETPEEGVTAEKESSSEKIESKFSSLLAKLDNALEVDIICISLSLIAFVVGIWNFFAPDFGAGFQATIVGAFIPSVVLLVDALVLYPGFVEKIIMPNNVKDKYYEFIKKASPMMGLITFIFAVLHAMFSGLLFL